jgi:two-component system, LytTR family, response regulator
MMGGHGATDGPSDAGLTVLVVDDEAPARRKLRRLLSRSPGVERVFEASSGQLALEVIEEFDPDVVFLDIRMPGMDGFQLLDSLGPERPPGLIFVTAYDEHAIGAFEVGAVDYLLKPFDQERFREALERARRAVLGTRAQTEAAPEGLAPLVSAVRQALFSNAPRRLVVRSRPGRKVLLELERVVRIEADRNETVFHAETGEFRLRSTLTDLEARLDPNRFLRINRSEIVNLDRVIEMEPLSHGDVKVHLETGEIRRMTRRYRDRLDRFL